MRAPRAVALVERVVDQRVDEGELAGAVGTSATGAASRASRRPARRRRRPPRHAQAGRRRTRGRSPPPRETRSASGPSANAPLASTRCSRAARAWPGSSRRSASPCRARSHPTRPDAGSSHRGRTGCLGFQPSSCANAAPRSSARGPPRSQAASAFVRSSPASARPPRPRRRSASSSVSGALGAPGSRYGHDQERHQRSPHRCRTSTSVGRVASAGRRGSASLEPALRPGSAVRRPHREEVALSPEFGRLRIRPLASRCKHRDAGPARRRAPRHARRSRPTRSPPGDQRLAPGLIWRRARVAASVEDGRTFAPRLCASSAASRLADPGFAAHEDEASAALARNPRPWRAARTPAPARRIRSWRRPSRRQRGIPIGAASPCDAPCRPASGSLQLRAERKHDRRIGGSREQVPPGDEDLPAVGRGAQPRRLITGCPEQSSATCVHRHRRRPQAPGTLRLRHSIRCCAHRPSTASADATPPNATIARRRGLDLWPPDASWPRAGCKCSPQSPLLRREPHRPRGGPTDR